MKKISLLVTVFLCGMCLFSQEKISIHEHDNIDIKLSSIFKHAKIVELETNQKCLISVVSTLKIDTGRIFIYDNKLGKLFIFDSNGRFINWIGRKGNGPEEFSRPKDFTLDLQKKQIEILDSSKEKIFKFDYDGRFIEDQKSPSLPDFEKINSDKYIGYSSNYTIVLNDKVVKSDLIVFNTKGELVKEFKGIRNISKSIQFETNSNFVMSNKGDVYLIPIYENTLFKVDSNLELGKVCDFVFDTRISHKPFQKVQGLNEAIKVSNDKNYPFMINGLNVIDDNVSFWFFYKRKIYHSFVNLRTGNSRTVSKNNIINDLTLIETNGFLGSFDSGLIDVQYSEYFLSSYKEIVNSGKEVGSFVDLNLREKFLELAETKDPYSNPMLFYYYYDEKN